jgi:hypothetical protein
MEKPTDLERCMETLTDLESFMKNLQILKAEQSLNARIFEPLAEPVQINK